MADIEDPIEEPIVDDEEEELGEDAYAMMTEELVEYADALELQQFEHEQAGQTLLFPNGASNHWGNYFQLQKANARPGHGGDVANGVRQGFRRHDSR